MRSQTKDGLLFLSWQAGGSLKNACGYRWLILVYLLSLACVFKGNKWQSFESHPNMFVLCPIVHKNREGESSILSPFLDGVAQSSHPSLFSALQKNYPFILTMLQHDHPSIFSRSQQNISINAPYIIDAEYKTAGFQAGIEESYLTNLVIYLFWDNNVSFWIPDLLDIPKFVE